jgi:hypothetical protein
VHEIERPPLVDLRDCRHRVSAPQGNTTLHPSADLQVCLTVDPQDPLDVVLDAFAAQQDRQSAKAEPTPFRGKLLKPLAQRRIVWPTPNVPNHPTICTEVPARASFADVEYRSDRLHSSTPL